MPIKSGQSVFLKKIQPEKLKELNALYEARDPFAEKLNLLEENCKNIQGQLDFYKEDEDLYDEGSEYKNDMKELEEKLQTAQIEVLTSKVRKPLFDIQDKIIALEVTLYGKTKLTSLNELDALYAMRDRLEKKQNYLVEKVKDTKQQMVDFKTWEHTYKASEYEGVIKDLTTTLLRVQQKIIAKGLDKSLYDIDQKIITIETELYGKPKLTSPHENIKGLSNR